MSEKKLTILGNRRVGKRKTLQTKMTVNDCMMLHCVRPVSLDIWRVEWCLPGSVGLSVQNSGHFLFSKHVLWSAAIMPMWMLHVSRILFRKVSSYSILQFIFKNSVTIHRETYF